MLAASLLLVPFLPLYVERTMVRSWRTDRVGDVIEWGWRARTLSGYWSDYKYFRPEQRPALWLGVNLALAFVYALVVVLCVDYVLARLGRRAAAEDKRVV
jgi:hypothetical protein